jgi:hypothetical protein
MSETYNGISDIQKGYQSRTNIVKDEKDGLFTDFYSLTRLTLNFKWPLKS